MLFLYGSCEYADMISDNAIILNLNSLKEDATNLNLMPPNSLGAVSDYDFDCRYADYIMNNDSIFVNMMNLIYTLYNQKNVYICIDITENWAINVAQSLFKFIQQRYGLNATFINSVEDFNCIGDTDFNPYYGIENFSLDNDRYVILFEKDRIMNGGIVEYE